MTDHLVRAAGLGLILVALSELAFYPVALGFGSAWLLAAYVAAALLVSLVAAARRRAGRADSCSSPGWRGSSSRACRCRQLYEVPLFSIVWTPLAWHALVSLGAGVALWRWALARGWLSGALAALAFGAALGCWGGWA